MGERERRAQLRTLIPREQERGHEQQSISLLPADTSTLLRNPIQDRREAHQTIIDYDGMFMDHQGEDIRISLGRRIETQADREANRERMRRLIRDYELRMQVDPFERVQNTQRPQNRRENTDSGEEEEEEEEVRRRTYNGLAGEREEGFFPYKSKIVCSLNKLIVRHLTIDEYNGQIMLLDMLCNLPRLRLSDTQVRAVIFVLKEAGVANVPSFETLRRIQKKLHQQISVPVQKNVSTKGNIYYTNDIRSQIAADFRNPLLRPFLEVYPEDKEGYVSEAWHASKWCKGADLDVLTPMAISTDGIWHFYVNELTKCVDGSFCIPLRWIKRRGELTVDGYMILCV